MSGSADETESNERLLARRLAENETLATAIGYTFSEPQLLLCALTHRSHTNESATDLPHNERLEFIGDAVVDLAIGHYLMERLPAAREGQLSKLRAMVVSEAALARTAHALELGRYLRLGRGEEHTGGREKASILADALEALIGAIFVDGGYEAARTVTCRLLETLAQEAVNGDLDRDHKTRLQELVQSSLRQIPHYEVVDERGPDHAKIFRVAVRLGQREVASAEGHSKKQAEQRAARLALAALEDRAALEH